MALNKWDFVLLACMLILVMYSVFTAIHTRTEQRAFCSNLCSAFEHDLQEVRGGYCICENGLSYPMYDLESYVKALS